MIDCVLDASVLLAMAKREPGAEQAAALIPKALVSAVNHAEIISKLIEWDHSGELANVHKTPPYVIADFNADLAYRVGLLRADTRAQGLSLGDRACLALAMREGLPVYTADRRWAELALGIDINVIR